MLPVTVTHGATKVGVTLGSRSRGACVNIVVQAQHGRAHEVPVAVAFVLSSEPWNFRTKSALRRGARAVKSAFEYTAIFFERWRT